MRPLLLLACALASGCAAQSPAPCAPCQQAAASPPTAAAAPSAATARPAALDELGQKRVDLARKRIEILSLMYDHGALSLNELLLAYREVAFAARDSHLTGDALHKALQDYRDAMVALEGRVKQKVANGSANDADMLGVEGSLAEAEYWLAEAQP